MCTYYVFIFLAALAEVVEQQAQRELLRVALDAAEAEQQAVGYVLHATRLAEEELASQVHAYTYVNPDI